MIPDIRLDLDVTVTQGRISGVTVLSNRMVGLTQGFAGKNPVQVLALLPTLFSLCGMAQGLAGAMAVERAAGLVPHRAHGVARDLLLAAEILAEHGLGVARDWQFLLSREPRLDLARGLKSAQMGLRRILYPQGDFWRPGGGLLAPDLAQVRQVLDQFQDCLSHILPLAEEVVRHLARKGLADFGATPLLAMPDDGPAELDARLKADLDGLFLARPDSQGRIYETGPMARMGGGDLRRPGLCDRFQARIEEMQASLRLLAELGHSLEQAGPGCFEPVSGQGLAVVEATRGMLAHRVELVDGVIGRYQILAPTEWNFHPQGVVSRALLGAPAADVEFALKAFVMALDPCVPFDLAVSHA